jgi:hypothetical protein
VISIHGGVVSIENCTFRASTQTAVHIEGGAVDIQSTEFVANGGSAVRGGAIFASAGFVNIGHSRFHSNVAQHGAALYADGNASLLVRNTIFLNNNASRSGGAMHVAGSARVRLGDMTLLLDNLAPEGFGRSALVAGVGSRVLYVLPAPLGHWVANTFICSAALGDGGTCTHDLHNRTLTALPYGATDDSFPFRCAPCVAGSRPLGCLVAVCCKVARPLRIRRPTDRDSPPQGPLRQHHQRCASAHPTMLWLLYVSLKHRFDPT